ncbi:MAG: YkgJ family cysteine cluster protein [Clostridium sp.]|uniref:YkgJ family cysteine cluster protein n=1 Tax=Clostridium sp. TaxID=1506 RepID=UPI003D6C944D
MQINSSAVIIPKDQLCICGSGVNFSNCCMKKNHIYESLLLPDTGRQVIYDQTEIIMAIQKLNGFIEARIDPINTELSPKESIRKLGRLYEKLDNALKPIAKVTSCKQGCNHCCFLPILSSQLENELIKDYMNEHYSPDKLAEFKGKINQNKDVLSQLVHVKGRFMNENYKLYANANIPCAFLDGDNNCSIYSVRPFICRKYLVFNESVLCENPLNKTDQYYSPYLTKVKDSIIKLNKLTYGEDFSYKHILSWFV